MRFLDAAIAARSLHGALLIKRRFGAHGLRYLSIVLLAISCTSFAASFSYDAASAEAIQYRSFALLFAMLAGMCVGGMAYVASSRTRDVGISFLDAEVALRVERAATTASLVRTELVHDALRRCGVTPEEMVRLRGLRREKLDVDLEVLNAPDCTLALMQASPSIRAALAATGDSLERALAWSRRVERLRAESERWWSPDRLRRIPSIGVRLDRPYLPVTRRFGHPARDERGYPAIVARRPLYSAVVRDIEEALTGGARNALVVADDHRSAMDAVLAFSHAVDEGAVDHGLEGLETYFIGDDACRLDGDAHEECVGRLVAIIEEAARVGGVILVVRHLDMLVEAMHAAGEDAFRLVGAAIDRRRVPVIAIADSKGYHRTLIANRKVVEHFSFVRVSIDTDEDARTFLEDAVSIVERRGSSIVTVDAIDEALSIARRTRPGRSPSFSALEVVDDVLEGIKDERPTIVDAVAIRRYLGEIDMPAIAGPETEVELERVEQAITLRVIGQEHAAQAAIGALRAAYAGLRRDDRPLSTMLFVGPAGSGKSELAHAIAEHLLGHDAFVELAGGDFSDEGGAARLRSALDSACERAPRVAVVSDIDTLSPAARIALLEVLQGASSATHARDSVIIGLTSVGADHVTHETTTPALIEAIRHAGVPKEFIDVFDAVVPFQPLSREGFRSVITRAVRRAADSLRERGVTLDVTPWLVEHFSNTLYDARYGASEVDRMVARAVEDPIARALLSGSVRKGQVVELVARDPHNPQDGLMAKVR